VTTHCVKPSKIVSPAPPMLLRAGLTSMSIMSVADMIAQATEYLVLGSTPEKPRSYDPHRTARFALVGLTLHGPYFQRGFAWVDRHFGPSLLKNKPLWPVIGKKVVTTQFVLNAPFMVLLFGWVGVLEGKRKPQQLYDNIVAKWPAAFWAGNAFWPVANCINFRFLGPQHRVAYVASCGAVWNTYISLLNQYKDEQAVYEDAQANQT
jgi:protein Mpv17